MYLKYFEHMKKEKREFVVVPAVLGLFSCAVLSSVAQQAQDATSV